MKGYVPGSIGEEIAKRAAFFMARCENCELDMPFDDRAARDRWVEIHRLACRHAVTTWTQVPTREALGKALGEGVDPDAHL